MPKWRKLHVKATESLDINDMPDDFTRLLWVMLPLALDCAGRGLDNPAWVKSKVMPLRTDVDCECIVEAMDWFSERGMLERYSVNGRSYFWVPSFFHYQGNTSKEAPSEYPPPPSWVEDEPDATDAEPSPEQVESRSGLGQALDSDADVESDSEGEGANAQPPKKPKTPAQENFEQLAAVCQYDLAAITKKQRGELNQTEGVLRQKCGATPELIKEFGVWWYANDWRGKDDNSPIPKQVRETWGKFKRWYDNGNSGQSGESVLPGHSGDTTKADMDAKLDRLKR